MVYNRFGFAVLALVLIEILAEPAQARKRARAGLLSGVSTGIACVVLLFLKASYFLVAAALVLVYAVVSAPLPPELGWAVWWEPASPCSGLQPICGGISLRSWRTKHRLEPCVAHGWTSQMRLS